MLIMMVVPFVIARPRVLLAADRRRRRRPRRGGERRPRAAARHPRAPAGDDRVGARRRALGADLHPQGAVLRRRPRHRQRPDRAVAGPGRGGGRAHGVAARSPSPPVSASASSSRPCAGTARVAVVRQRRLPRRDPRRAAAPERQAQPGARQRRRRRGRRPASSSRCPSNCATCPRSATSKMALDRRRRRRCSSGIPGGWSSSQQLLAAFAMVWAMVAVSLVVLTGWGGHISPRPVRLRRRRRHRRRQRRVEKWHGDFFLALFLAGARRRGRWRCSSACRRCASRACSSRSRRWRSPSRSTSYFFNTDRFTSAPADERRPRRCCWQRFEPRAQLRHVSDGAGVPRAVDPRGDGRAQGAQRTRRDRDA